MAAEHTLLRLRARRPETISLIGSQLLRRAMPPVRGRVTRPACLPRAMICFLMGPMPLAGNAKCELAQAVATASQLPI